MKDNGIRVDTRYHRRIFGIFERLSPKSPAARMGWSMVQRIAEKCGGKPRVVSERGWQGLQFLMYPVANANPRLTRIGTHTRCSLARHTAAD